MLTILERPALSREFIALRGTEGPEEAIRLVYRDRKQIEKEDEEDE